uniref:Uncharacterized protein n=1 Tax=Arion vulgaris TaxID=1028688 RepID=A0A0B7BQK6_9EUPU
MAKWYGVKVQRLLGHWRNKNKGKKEAVIVSEIYKEKRNVTVHPDNKEKHIFTV